MNTTLFGQDATLDVLEFHYDGPSFKDGRIEIDKLAFELSGLHSALRIAVAGMIRYKRTTVSAGDVYIYIEPFKKGSFRKKIRVVIKRNKDVINTGISLCTLVVSIIALVNSKPVEVILKMDAVTQAEIADPLKVELLKDPEFLKGIAAAARPLMQDTDKLELGTAQMVDQTINIGLDGKLKLETLAGSESKEKITQLTTMVVGRVTAVDLDATKHHIGFKLDNKGTTIWCTLANDMDQDSKKALLGQWVAITGVVTYEGKRMSQIDIIKIKTAKEPKQTHITPEGTVN